MSAPLVSLFAIFLATASADTLATPRLTCGVVQDAGTTTLTARVKGFEESAVFRIDWKSPAGKAEGFKAAPARDGAITSTHRFGKTTVTRTILASAAADCLLIHVVADQPGAVSFNARFVSEHPPEIRNRREILLSGKGIHAHAWIIPFESDVSDNGKTITLQGEGEALILLNLTADPGKRPVSGTLTRLGEKYDPGHPHPNPHLVWEGLGKTQDTGKD